MLISLKSTNYFWELLEHPIHYTASIKLFFRSWVQNQTDVKVLPCALNLLYKAGHDYIVFNMYPTTILCVPEQEQQYFRIEILHKHCQSQRTYLYDIVCWETYDKPQNIYAVVQHLEALWRKLRIWSSKYLFPMWCKWLLVCRAQLLEQSDYSKWPLLIGNYYVKQLQEVKKIDISYWPEKIEKTLRLWAKWYSIHPFLSFESAIFAKISKWFHVFFKASD